MTDAPRAQLVVHTTTKEGRYVTRIYDRDVAEQLQATIENAMRIDGEGDTTATVGFETFALGGGGRVTLRGRLITGVKLIPIEAKHTATYRPGPDGLIDHSAKHV